jgi:uncharacterized small protein (DUF1192 family)
MGKSKLKLASKKLAKRKRLKKKKAAPAPPPPPDPASSSSSEDSSSDDSSSSDASSAGDAAAERGDERTPASSSSDDDDDSDDDSDAAPNLSGDAELEGVLTLDERIALLEAELARESSDSDSDSSDDESDDETGDVRPKKVARGVLASLVDDRIPPLPAHLLPQAPPKKRHFDGPPQRTKPGTADGAFARASPAQLQQAHRLVDACAASEKVKRELYCRLCAFQGSDLADLERHRRSDLHLLATRVWRDRSYCKLCRVQTTSPNELAVHLTCKKHKERLAEVENGRAGRGGGRGGGRSGGRGRGGRGRGGRF